MACKINVSGVFFPPFLFLSLSPGKKKTPDHRLVKTQTAGRVDRLQTVQAVCVGNCGHNYLL